MVRVKDVFDSIEDAYYFVRSRPKHLFMEFLKIVVLAVAVILAILLVGGALGVGLSMLVGSSTTGNIIVGVWFALVVLVMLYFAIVVGSPAYHLVQEEYRNKKISIIDTAKSNAFPLLKYGISYILLNLVLLLPFLILLGGIIYATGIDISSFSTDETLQGIASSTLNLFIILPLLILGFFIQLGFFELLLNRKGAIESLKDSISLVRGNFFETVLFSVLVTALVQVAMLPILILFLILIFGAIFALVFPPAGMCCLILVIIPMILVTEVINLMVSLPITYLYWCRISKRKP